MSVDSGEQLSNAYRWYVVILLLCVSILAYIDRIVFALLIDPIKTDLHISDTQAGVLVGLAFSLSYAVAGLALGRIVDRHKRNIVLGVALAVWSCFTMLSGFTVGVTLLFLARCGVGIGESAVNPASIAIIGSSFPRDRVSYGLSTFSVGIYGGGGLAIILGGQLSAYLTSFGPISIFGSPIAVWRLVFICVGVPGTAARSPGHTHDSRQTRQAESLAIRRGDETLSAVGAGRFRLRVQPGSTVPSPVRRTDCFRLLHICDPGLDPGDAVKNVRIDLASDLDILWSSLPDRRRLRRAAGRSYHPIS
jgi:MFS family permease